MVLMMKVILMMMMIVKRDDDDINENISISNDNDRHDDQW